jgi:hypothetical protein
MSGGQEESEEGGEEGSEEEGGLEEGRQEEGQEGQEVVPAAPLGASAADFWDTFPRPLRRERDARHG